MYLTGIKVSKQVKLVITVLLAWENLQPVNKIGDGPRDTVVVKGRGGL